MRNAIARIAEIIDADEERRRLGRERFKTYRDLKLALETHQIDDRGCSSARTIMDKAYSPADIETRIYARWETSGYFAPSGTGPAYSIVIPPPNVTGTLHMGHAFQDTIMDALIRYRRMQGFDTLWQPGTDHAGIATQMVVERQLNAAGQSRIELGREAFVERVSGSGRSSPAADRQADAPARRLGRLAARPLHHGSRTVARGDRSVRAAVREGLIYRGKRLVNWDPVLKTALSDLEVVAEEETGSLWHLRYPLERRAMDYLVVATTRPETMLGDAAVAVHPDDERYRHLVGTQRAAAADGARDSRSSPTPTSIRHSAAAASRSRRRTISTTTRSASATPCP